jgi:hypothetical protein
VLGRGIIGERDKRDEKEGCWDKNEGEKDFGEIHEERR